MHYTVRSPRRIPHHVRLPDAEQKPMRTLYLFAYALLCCAVSLAMPLAAAAQEGRAGVRIVAREDGTGVPVTGAQVVVSGVGTVALSDSSGVARAGVVPPGIRLVKVMRVGYLPESFAVEFRPGETVEAEVDLQRAPLELEGLTVTERMPSRTLRDAGFYDRRRMGFGKFVGREEIDARRDGKLSSLMMNLPGVNVVYCPFPRCLQPGYILIAGGTRLSASSNCRMVLYVDGVRVPNEDIDRIRVQNLDGVEVYTRLGGIPVQFAGTDASCGVALLWSRTS